MFRPRSAVLAILTCSLCCAQSITIGAKAGARASGDLSGRAVSESKRYVAGPSIEIGLSKRLSAEVDALYRRHGYRTGDGSAFFSALIQERANVWEVPFLFKGELSARRAFFAGGGFSLQSIRGTESTIVTTLNPPTGERATERTQTPTSWELGEGVVMASGFKVRRGRLVLSPEVRYTRWLTPAIDVSRSRGFVFSSARNQIDFFLGIGWGLR